MKQITKHFTCGFFTLLLLLQLPAQNLDSGLIAYYPFDGNADDLSINQNHGIMMGDATFTSGILGQSLKLDGDGDYVHLGNGLQLGGNFTVSAWVKLYTSDRDWSTVLGKWKEGNAPDGGYWFGFGFASPHISVSNASGSSKGIQSQDVISTNTWVHITYIGENLGSNYQGKIYINGILTLSEPIEAIQANAISVWVGASPNLPDPWYLLGEIDELCVFNRVLTNAEINLLQSSHVGLKGLHKVAVELFSHPQGEYYELKLPQSIQSLHLEVHSVSGARIFYQVYDSAPNSRKIPIDLSHLPSGFYIIRGICEDAYFVKKIVIH